jgi:Na+-driven multidrug efflux pump
MESGYLRVVLHLHFHFGCPIHHSDRHFYDTMQSAGDDGFPNIVRCIQAPRNVFCTSVLCMNLVDYRRGMVGAALDDSYSSRQLRAAWT